MKKIGNRPITEADTDFSKISTKSEQNFDEFWSFMSAPFGTVTQCSVEPTVPKGALRKFQNSSKFCSDLVDIKNSAKDLQTPLKTNEKFI